VITSSIWQTLKSIIQYLIINSSNNKFYFDKDDNKIVIPEESYKLRDIDKYLKRAILSSKSNAIKKKMLRKEANEDEQSEYSLVIHANNNMMKSKIKCVYIILNKFH